MGCSRETNNIWFYLKKGWWKYFFRSFRGSYFWHDSFGVYINRWFICPIFGHRKVKYLEGQGNPEENWFYCFACRKYVKEK